MYLQRCCMRRKCTSLNWWNAVALRPYLWGFEWFLSRKKVFDLGTASGLIQVLSAVFPFITWFYMATVDTMATVGYWWMDWIMVESGLHLGKGYLYTSFKGHLKQIIVSSCHSLQSDLLKYKSGCHSLKPFCSFPFSSMPWFPGQCTPDFWLWIRESLWLLLLEYNWELRERLIWSRVYTLHSAKELLNVY